MLRLIKTDSGRKLSINRSKQGNDCSVRALSKATRLTYDEAYDLLKKHGRVSGQGVTENSLDKMFEREGTINGYKATKLAWRGITVANLIRNLPPKGTYLVGITKHIFVIHDGAIYDDHHNYLHETVTRAYKINHIWEENKG